MRIPSRVYNNPEIATRNEKVTKGESKKSSSTSSGAKSASSDVRVSVSSEARVMASDSAMDVQKVERLQAAIASGEFEMNFELVADNIVESGG